jgi:endoglucanase
MAIGINGPVTLPPGSFDYDDLRAKLEAALAGNDAGRDLRVEIALQQALVTGGDQGGAVPVLPMWGVNISGTQYERGDPAEAQLDGAPIRPLDWKWDYVESKGVKIVRLPFSWENTQPSLFGTLGMEMGGYSSNVGSPDLNSLQMLKSQIAKAAARGISIVLECKNYGARAVPDGNGSMAARTGYGLDGKYAIGSPEVPVTAFADFWGKMAAEFRKNPTVAGFDIMNEPTNMAPGETYDNCAQNGHLWATAAQAAITSIRDAGSRQRIIVEGYRFSSAERWADFNPTIHLLHDPLDGISFSPHLYFDSNHSGRYLGAEAAEPSNFNASLTRMHSDMDAFLAWKNQYGFQAFVGETGAPNTAEWQEIQRQFLFKCRDNDIPVTLWGVWPVGDGPQNINDLTPIGGTMGVGGVDTIAMQTLAQLIDEA